MPLQETSGAASYDAFGGGAAAVPNYIEDCFSCYLYTGNGSTQTITNGIDLSTKGGLVWLKGRSTAGQRNGFFDTQRGVSKFIWSDSTAGQNTFSGFGVTAFGASGFTAVDDSGGGYWVNGSGITYASWTFRKQPKFFDVVTWTGNNANNRAISHSLGSVPAVIIIKNTSDVANWVIYQQDQGTSKYATMGSAAFQTDTGGAVISTPTTSSFYVALNRNVSSNTSGATYVAYLFASNAGGFGVSGTDNVITCGSYTGNGSATSGPVVNLGYEPQFLLVKGATTSGEWYLLDNMRGLPVGGGDTYLSAGTSAAETTISEISPTATGFQVNSTDTTINRSGYSFIYIAIRRGPMKVPTSGTSVFYPISQTGNANNTSVGFSPDWTPLKISNGVGNWAGYDRLRGINQNLQTNTTAAESTVSTIIDGWLMNGVDFGSGIGGTDKVFVPCFKRAPGFMDVVCFYAIAGSSGAPTQTFNHNLGVTPEFAISKTRTTANSWFVYSAALGTTKRLRLQSDGAEQVASYFTALTSSTFTIDNYNSGTPADNNVAYLFASCPGVSKVGSYTGSGTTKQVNCGFTAGARFVLIKRTDSTGDWYVWDSARGIVAGNDPYLLLNSTAAEVTSTDYVDTYSAGFEISSTAPAAINANGGTFIFLAIA
jgi:hypothetical protein